MWFRIIVRKSIFLSTIVTNSSDFSHNSVKYSKLYCVSSRYCANSSSITRLLLSSQIDKNNELRGQEKILEICRKLGAQEYYNAIGGRRLYSVRKFEENGIGLWFVQMDEICYPQFSQPFEPGLSILDVMMFNPPERIRDMLGKYELVGGEDRSWSEKGEVCICRNRI